VVSKSPELIKLLQEHNEARQRYETIYSEMHSPKSETASAKP
jgi:hypothetical protein